MRAHGKMVGIALLVALAFAGTSARAADKLWLPTYPEFVHMQQASRVHTIAALRTFVLNYEKNMQANLKIYSALNEEQSAMWAYYLEFVATAWGADAPPAGDTCGSVPGYSGPLDCLYAGNRSCMKRVDDNDANSHIVCDWKRQGVACTDGLAEHKDWVQCSPALFQKTGGGVLCEKHGEGATDACKNDSIDAAAMDNIMGDDAKKRADYASATAFAAKYCKIDPTNPNPWALPDSVWKFNQKNCGDLASRMKDIYDLEQKRKTQAAADDTRCKDTKLIHICGVKATGWNSEAFNYNVSYNPTDKSIITCTGDGALVPEAQVTGSQLKTALDPKSTQASLDLRVPLTGADMMGKNEKLDISLPVKLFAGNNATDGQTLCSLDHYVYLPSSNDQKNGSCAFKSADYASSSAFKYLAATAEKQGIKDSTDKPLIPPALAFNCGDQKLQIQNAAGGNYDDDPLFAAGAAGSNANGTERNLARASGSTLPPTYVEGYCPPDPDQTKKCWLFTGEHPLNTDTTAAAPAALQGIVTDVEKSTAGAAGQ